MTQQQLTELNLGQSLDDLANLDPRGYGVCKILYKSSLEYTGAPLTMNAAEKLVRTVRQGDFVFIMTGFVLRPLKHAETDGIISSMLLARALVKAFGAKPVIICPEENLKAVEALAACVGLHLFKDMETLKEMPVSMGVIVFTKDKIKAAQQADDIIKSAVPSALISIECPGENSIGTYHNAVGLDVTELEAKQDILFDKLQEMGVMNIAIGDLGNEMGMGTISDQLNRYIPYAAHGACSCGCNGGLAARTKADNIITATVSDWGCYGMMAALAFLKEDIDICPDAVLEERALITACENGMIDMYGWLIPAIDGFNSTINTSIVTLMRECVKSALSLKETCKTWFSKVDELGFFG